MEWNGRSKQITKQTSFTIRDLLPTPHSRERKKKMNCGVILNNHFRTTTTTRRRRRSTTTSTTTNQVWFCVSFKIPHLNQQVFRSSSSSSVYRLRTKASIKEDVLEEEEEEEEEEDSFYQLLGISESGSFSEIKQAYKQLARKYHPDVSPPDRTEEYTKRFIQVQEAYEILSDPNRRAMYDRDLARGFLHLAFSARRRKQRYCYYHQEGVDDERSNWKNCWQTQLSGLKKKKSMNRGVSTNDNMSWGARMRRQRNQHSGGGGESSCEFSNHSLGFLLEFI